MWESLCQAPASMRAEGDTALSLRTTVLWRGSKRPRQMVQGGDSCHDGVSHLEVEEGLGSREGKGVRSRP